MRDREAEEKRSSASYKIARFRGNRFRTGPRPVEPFGPTSSRYIWLPIIFVGTIKEGLLTRWLAYQRRAARRPFPGNSRRNSAPVINGGWRLSLKIIAAPLLPDRVLIVCRDRAGLLLVNAPGNLSIGDPRGWRRIRDHGRPSIRSRGINVHLLLPFARSTWSSGCFIVSSPIEKAERGR